MCKIRCVFEQTFTKSWSVHFQTFTKTRPVCFQTFTKPWPVFSDVYEDVACVFRRLRRRGLCFQTFTKTWSVCFQTFTKTWRSPMSLVSNKALSGICNHILRVSVNHKCSGITARVDHRRLYEYAAPNGVYEHCQLMLCYSGFLRASSSSSGS